MSSTFVLCKKVGIVANVSFVTYVTVMSTAAAVAILRSRACTRRVAGTCDRISAAVLMAGRPASSARAAACSKSGVRSPLAHLLMIA